MTTTFKNARQAVGSSYTTVYTCPAATTAVVTNIHVANVDGTNAADVSAQWLDDSAADVATRLAEPITVYAKTALPILAKPIILEAGDALQLKASAAGDLEATVSIMERT